MRTWCTALQKALRIEPSSGLSSSQVLNEGKSENPVGLDRSFITYIIISVVVSVALLRLMEAIQLFSTGCRCHGRFRKHHCGVVYGCDVVNDQLRMRVTSRV